MSAAGSRSRPKRKRSVPAASTDSSLKDPPPSSAKRTTAKASSSSSRKRAKASAGASVCDQKDDKKTENTEVVQSQEQEDGAGECVICMEVPKSLGTIACCDHVFCSACILKWSKVTNKCPVCKRVFNEVTTVPPPTTAVAGKGRRKRAPPKPKVHKVKNKEQHVAPNYGGSMQLNFEDFFGSVLRGRPAMHVPMVGGVPFFMSRTMNAPFFEFMSMMHDDDDDPDYDDEEEEEEDDGFDSLWSIFPSPLMPPRPLSPLLTDRNRTPRGGSRQAQEEIVIISDDESELPVMSRRASPQFVDLTEDDTEGIRSGNSQDVSCFPVCSSSSTLDLSPSPTTPAFSSS